jgi:hypothetical protein
MKKSILFSVAIFLLLSIITSCEKDILDQKAVGDYNEQSVFTDLSLVQALIGRAYDNWGDESFPLNCKDDLLASATDETMSIHRPTRYTWTVGTMTPVYLRHFDSNRFGFMVWRYVYDNIQLVNTILANIDDVPVDNTMEKEWRDRMKGEAYFIRALGYSNILRTYGGLVLVDKPLEYTDDFRAIKRSSYEETVGFILADCDSAISLLPAKDQIEQGRATKGAAAFIKSRVLSWNTGILVNGGYEPTEPLVSFQSGSRTQRLQAAKSMARAIIDGQYGYYALTTIDGGHPGDPPSPMTDEDVQAYTDNFTSIFTQKGQWDDEVVWGIQYNNLEGNLNRINKWNGPVGYNNWGNNTPLEPVIRKFEMKDGTPFVWDKYDPGNFEIRTATALELAEDPERNPYVGREPRLYATLFYHGAKWQKRPDNIWYPNLDPEGRIQSGYFVDRTTNTTVNGLDTRQSLISAWCGTRNGYFLRKFMDIETVGQYENNENTWVEFRYAEVILDYAEACIELGDVQEGLDALNMIRNRAGLPDRVTADQVEAREWYRKERQLEMYAEGDRFWMIRKWMIADQVIENVHPMIVYEYTDATGGCKWFYDTQSDVDTRRFVHHTYWLPISSDEISKAPQLQQNPGY